LLSGLLGLTDKIHACTNNVQQGAWRR